MMRPDRDQPRHHEERKNNTRIWKKGGFVFKRTVGASCMCIFAYLGMISMDMDNADQTPPIEPSRSRELNAIRHRGFVRESSSANAVTDERVPAAGATGARVLIRHRGFMLDPDGTPIASVDSETTADIARILPNNFLKPKSSAGSFPTVTADVVESMSMRGNDRNTATVTVHLTMTPNNPAWSIFLAHTLQRYGSGHYIIDNDATCGPPPEPINAPCLAVTRERMCSAKQMKSFYPNCKTMTTNDEWCKWREYDVREYYSSRMSNKAYLPLGPRLEAWKSFKRITLEGKEGELRIKPASQRKYAFNAIFSKETGASREDLTAVLRNNHESNNGAYIKIAENRTIKIDDPDNDMLDTDSYVRVLLESAFTLAPSGHNPECFRLYEAVEAGSIPVFAADRHYHTHPCKDSLRAWVEESPILVVDTWGDVHSAIAKLVDDPAGLDERQGRLRKWYGDYMRETMGKFESFVLDEEVVLEI